MGTPLSGSAMSGDFDFPPASRDPAHSSAAGLARPDPFFPRYTHQSISRQSDVAEESNDSNAEERRRIQRIQHSEIPDSESGHRLPHDGRLAADYSVPISALRSRIQSSRPRYRPQDRNLGSDISLQQAADRLNEASSDLSSLLNQPIPRLGSPDIHTREYSGEAAINRRRKRRRLDSGSSSNGMGGFSYGYRGQVVSGPLKLEINHCDGGLHSGTARQGCSYGPENVLRNDKTVYCTDSSQCNLILRHQSEATFSLRKIVVKAPERGFTAPIQEGMIFVTMTSSDLLSRTTRYQLHRRPSYHHDVEQSDNIAVQDEMRRDRPLSRRRDSTSRIVPPPLDPTVTITTPRSYRNNLRVSERPVTESGAGGLSTPLHDMLPPSGPSDFQISAHCNDPSSDEEEPSSAATIADRYRRDRMRFPIGEPASDEDTEDGLERALQERGLSTVAPNDLHIRGRRELRRARPGRIEVVPPTHDPKVVQNEDQGILAPHARFFIEDGRSVVSVAFDPPVSGKYILLKLWSPHEGQNIDIQSIVAHGFAGPRFFPAKQMM